MRIILELILLALGTIIGAFSVEHRRLPGGIAEWAVWILDALIIVLRVAGV